VLQKKSHLSGWNVQALESEVIAVDGIFSGKAKLPKQY